MVKMYNRQCVRVMYRIRNSYVRGRWDNKVFLLERLFGHTERMYYGSLTMRTYGADVGWGKEVRRVCMPKMR